MQENHKSDSLKLKEKQADEDPNQEQTPSQYDEPEAAAPQECHVEKIIPIIGNPNTPKTFPNLDQSIPNPVDKQDGETSPSDPEGEPKNNEDQPHSPDDQMGKKNKPKRPKGGKSVRNCTVLELMSEIGHRTEACLILTSHKGNDTLVNGGGLKATGNLLLSFLHNNKKFRSGLMENLARILQAEHHAAQQQLITPPKGLLGADGLPVKQ